MDTDQFAEPETKPLRPNERREVTDSVYKAIVDKERLARQEKTRRLEAARIAVATPDGVKPVRNRTKAPVLSPR